MQDTIWANDGDTKVATIADLPWIENSVTGRRSSDFDTEQANARLIAAAPDLLEACQRLLSAFESDYKQIPDMDIKTSWETNSQAIANARQAIACATGGQQ
jgi:hypothetical protein